MGAVPPDSASRQRSRATTTASMASSSHCPAVAPQASVTTISGSLVSGSLVSGILVSGILVSGILVSVIVMLPSRPESGSWIRLDHRRAHAPRALAAVEQLVGRD